MALSIERVAVNMDVAPDESRREASRPLTDADLRERLRPIVLEILSTEIDKLRREQGGPS